MMAHSIQGLPTDFVYSENCLHVVIFQQNWRQKLRNDNFFKHTVKPCMAHVGNCEPMKVQWVFFAYCNGQSIEAQSTAPYQRSLKQNHSSKQLFINKCKLAEINNTHVTQTAWKVNCEDKNLTVSLYRSAYGAEPQQSVLLRLICAAP